MSRRDVVPGPRWASRLALLLTAVTALVMVTLSTSHPVHASVPSDQVQVPVGGSALGGIITSPAMSPQFASATHDYVIYCGLGLNVITMSLSGANGGTIQAGGQSGPSITLTLN